MPLSMVQKVQGTPAAEYQTVSLLMELNMLIATDFHDLSCNSLDSFAREAQYRNLLRKISVSNAMSFQRKCLFHVATKRTL